jgi:hypothetical protein
MTLLKIEDIIQTGSGSVKREVQGTQHLSKDRSDYKETTSRNILLHLPQYAKASHGIEMTEAQLFSWCITVFLTKLIHPSRQEISCHSWKCKDVYSVTKNSVLVHGGRLDGT